MDIKKFYVGRALVFLGVLMVLVVLFFSFNSYIYNEKQADPNDEFVPQRMTLSGRFICLPHKDLSGPQTDECAFGLAADNGFNYAVDFALMSQIPPQVSVGDRFTASGVFVPIERLSTDHWRKYDMVGIFSVTDSVIKTQTASTTISFPKGGEIFSRGKTYILRWSGGDDPVHVFLVDTSLKSQGASVSISDRVYNVKNTGSVEYTFPKTLKEGTYEFQIGNVTSKPFKVL